MQFIGIIGSLCFAFCLLPQVIKAYKDKSANGISGLFLLLSAVGNISSCAYVVSTNILSGVWQWPLYFNYAVALSLCLALAWAKHYYSPTALARCIEKEYEEWLKYCDAHSGEIRLMDGEEIEDARIQMKFPELRPGNIVEIDDETKKLFEKGKIF